MSILGGLIFGSNRRHRSFSSAVITRGQHIHRSGAPEKQANFRPHLEGDSCSSQVPHHRLVTDLHRLTSREFLDGVVISRFEIDPIHIIEIA
jgi:hypothetical protein